jgi:hypothetical protein
METFCTLETVDGMIERYGDRAATEALILASQAVMLGDLGGAIIWLDAVRQIRALLPQRSAWL